MICSGGLWAVGYTGVDVNEKEESYEEEELQDGCVYVFQRAKYTGDLHTYIWNAFALLYPYLELTWENKYSGR